MSRSKGCRREEARATVDRPSTIRTFDAFPHDVIVEDLSQTGFSFTSSSTVPTGAIVHVGLAGAGRAAAEVTWRSGDRHGCRFRPPLGAAQLSAAFSQPIEASITSLAPMAFRVSPSSLESRRGLPLYLRFVVISGTGMLGWGIIASALRAVPPL
jgi:hypothetical protein